MEVRFDKKTVPCLRRDLWQTQEREQTQEVKLSDGMPDIGTVVATRGQCVLRSKEWQSGSIGISGGIMVWVIYVPADGTQPRTVEAWIPVQMRLDLPDARREGSIRVRMQLRSIDGRTVSPRKVMVRADMSVTAEAVEPSEVEISTPEQVGEDVQLLRRRYPAVMAMEAGEKTFLVDEQIAASAAEPSVEEIVCFELSTQLSEQKVLGNKAVFRGDLRLHICYRSTDDTLHSKDIEVPFSQFSELDRDYDKEATLSVMMAVTNAEPEIQENVLRVKCGMVAQYMVYDRVMLELVEDAYALGRELQLRTEVTQIPMVLDRCVENVKGNVVLNCKADRLVDVWAYTAQPKVRQAGDLMEMELCGTMGALYLDEEGQLQGGTVSWRELVERPTSGETLVMADLMELSRPVAAMGPDQLEMRQEITAQIQTVDDNGVAMVTGVDMGDAVQPDRGRPSLILRRAGELSLWELAKKSGSTVEAIRQANGLIEEPLDDRILLIPVS